MHWTRENMLSEHFDTSPSVRLSAGRGSMLLYCVLWCCCCVPLVAGQLAGQPGAAPPLERCLSIRETASGEIVPLTTLIDKISTADVVFFGESHTDETTHRLELALYQALLERRQGNVVLALEMLERDVQETLDRYLAGKIDEATFLADAQPWSNYHEAYRPLVEQAKQASAPAIASNFPASLLRKFAIAGADALNQLSDEERQSLPRQYLDNTHTYWKRVDNAIRGHQGFTTQNDSEQERVYSTQSLWDNAMGEACADSLERHPGHLVFHVNGAFHSAYSDGVVRQLHLRKPQAQVVTIAALPALDPATEELRGLPTADYVVFVEARATNVEEGKHSVQIGGELEYLFHMPDSAEQTSRLPLLIAFPDRGLTAEESTSFYRELLGDLAAIAVLEPPYKELGDDLAIGGRWYWPETFGDDVGAVALGVGRVWAYLLRHYPVDPARVTLVGEGTGGTVAAAVTTHTDRVSLQAISIEPRQFAKLKDLPLLLPELYGADELPARTLQVIGSTSLREWWSKELNQYGAVGIPCEFVARSEDPWQFDRQLASALRTSLGLPELDPVSSQERRYLLLDSDSNRARLWGRLQALCLTQLDHIPTTAVTRKPDQESAVEIPIRIQPKYLANPEALPRCPGPFGGTTVVVIPDQAAAAGLQCWLELEANDPLTKTSRFHQVRMATSYGEHGLAKVLAKLHSENRNNVLIVPAVFYAETDWLRELRKIGDNFYDEMTLHWMPGLGGQQGILNR